jgi:hypothetical protein
MATLEEQFQQAAEVGDLPGVVLLANDTKGKKLLLITRHARINTH